MIRQAACSTQGRDSANDLKIILTTPLEPSIIDLMFFCKRNRADKRDYSVLGETWFNKCTRRALNLNLYSLEYGFFDWLAHMTTNHKPNTI